MARSRVAVAIVASFLLLLLAAQFVDFSSSLGGPAFLRHVSNSRTPEETTTTAVGDQYLIGVGKADITGPVVELNLMGYANASQIGTGLRQRLKSRAFIVGDPSNTNDRFVYLVLDTQSGDTAIRHGILQGLQDLGPDYSVYGNQNVAVTGTHSHSGPAAWLNYLLPQITSKGFDKQSYQAIVDGAVLSIQRAHQSLTEGRLSVGSTSVEDSNISRSLYAYLANPESERNKYNDNVDKNMTLLRFTRDSDGKDIGILTWFPVHGTSMLGNNTIITADNKGVAAYLFEESMANSSSAAPGFVSGFSQANVGDTSPNINGAWCEDGSNQQCSFQNSTCGGKSESCHGRGPYFGLNDGGTKSCFEIGRRQYAGAQAALSSMTSSATALSGPVRHFHLYHNMANFTFPKTYSNGTTIDAKACPAALGYSFAAGTTDGPGAFDFTQNDPNKPNASPVWAVVSNLLHAPSGTQKECQYPKPILLDVGETHLPYEWTPNIVDVQVFRVGELAIIVSPGEATTMSGRRWKAAVSSAITSNKIFSNGAEPLVVLGGPANTYAHYIATEEEYGVQRYEGASTLYGPHTLDAYINVTLDNLALLSDSAATNNPTAIVGTQPPINTNRSLDFITGVVYDSAGLGKSFGDVSSDVEPSSSHIYKTGETAVVQFVGANPRNNLRLEGTYTSVEMQASDGSWSQVRSDEDWDLLYEWKRTNEITGTSSVTISWEIGGGGKTDVQSGNYRIRYYGDAKAPITGKITAFEGVSGVFEVGA
ncbi:neutral/alkaline non-lysosomal ceramidase [Rhizodiscina lignyota]|uniref:Neutral ceramidase n=1 Tax=Rhizodiscina lignyota TaxID=1504668 RepID=A0A9P4IAQ6_9PEZI|nr:neutral/alkaline non-lysosomal ceramidase [Rhizodiscina lignyota]